MPDIDTSDLKAVWAAVLHRTMDRPALGWLNGLTLTQTRDNHATFVVAPGSAISSVARARMDQVAALLGDVLGRTIRATLDESDTPAAGQAGFADHHPQGQPGGTQSNGQTTPASATASSAAGNAAAGASAAGGAAAMAEARSLPLVTQVIRTFPHATVIDARRAADVVAPPDADERHAPAGPGAADHLPLDIDPPPLDDELYDEQE